MSPSQQDAISAIKPQRTPTFFLKRLCVLYLSAAPLPPLSFPYYGVPSRSEHGGELPELAEEPAAVVMMWCNSLQGYVARKTDIESTDFLCSQ
jgi:hypothetical protein